MYIAKILEETAENERQHAKDHLLLLGAIGDTAANLKEAIGGEDHEVRSMYPRFAKEAEEEGETRIADAFRQAPKIEAHHLEPPLAGDMENAHRRNCLETDLRFARLGIGFFLCSLFWP